MSTSNPPTITINGKKYTMQKPKIKLWRHMIRFGEAQESGELQGEAVLDEMLNLVVMAFNNEEVTAEAIEENMDFEDLPGFFNHIRQRVTGAANAKVSQLPNGRTPART